MFGLNTVHVKITSNDDIEDVLRQLRGVSRGLKEFPCTIRIYDRAFTLASKDEMLLLMTGLEMGWYLREEHLTKKEQPI